MKRIISFLMILLASFSLIGCKGNEAQTENGGSTTPGSNPDKTEVESKPTEENTEPVEGAKGFVIHYQRSDKDYDTWALWLWCDGQEGDVYEFNGKDDYGGYYKSSFADFGPEVLDNDLGLIVRTKIGWNKDFEDNRMIHFANYDVNKDGYYHFYLKQADGNIYISPDGDVNDKITRFDIQYDENTSNVVFAIETNKKFKDFEITVDGKVLFNKTVNKDKISVLEDKKLMYSYGKELPNISNEIVAKITFEKTGKTLVQGCNMASLYKTKIFNDLYNYDGELGAIYTKEQTTFRVWSPVANEISLRIYETGTPLFIYSHGDKISLAGGSNTYVEHKMTKGPKGTWEYTEKSDMAGKYYTYVVKNSKFDNQEIVDPYAKSTGINGIRGMVVDFSKTNPEGWDQVKLNGKKEQELVVYESHIADLTSSATWNGPKEKSRLFDGFAEAGTSYKGVTTGFDHIKELGVNSVQLLPIFDQANDERLENREFNWGYNPLNYNSLDGIYSKNPYDGYEKIKEFKNLVKQYSNAGINIIMDVVYNHTAGLDKSNFDVLMPGYYFRYNNGSALNGSGCGNETASDMYMFRKFMKDSTEFWAKEYKLGGFRFDLMALHDIETMNQLSANLKTKVDSTITIYGEPWNAGSVGLNSNDVALQSNMNRFEGFGCFNDKLRDALVKGGLAGAGEKGWITGTKNKMGNELIDIKNGIVGRIIRGNPKLEVEKCVNYVTCHDNYTLYDRIKAAGITDEETIKKMAMLSNSIVLTSQGINFMLSGEEFLRSKDGNHNSYNAPYELNELNYDLKVKNIDVFNNYKAIIKLHNTTDLFSKDNQEAANIQVKNLRDQNVVYYELKDSTSNRMYTIVHTNGYVGNLSKKLNLTGYKVYLDTLNQYKPNTELTSQTKLGEFQTLIAYKQL